MDFSYLYSQRRFINYVIEKKMIWPALVIGFLGIYSFPVVSFLARLATGQTIGNELVRLLVEMPIKSLVSLIFTILIVYSLILLFKGRKHFIDFSIAVGFSGLYSMLVSIAFTSGVALTPLLTQNGKTNQIFGVFTVFSMLAGFIAVYYEIKYSVIAISEIFKIKIYKSIIIWLIASIPLILMSMIFKIK